jgi:DNA-directed RNA polymerase subunit RPC12/RpoP
LSRKTENTGFICQNCGKEVLPLTNGSYRNHCPFCLCSLHVDILPGDRASDCGGIMDAVSLSYKPGKGWQILHVCRVCGHEMRNKVAEQTVQPDDVSPLLEKMQEEGRKSSGRKPTAKKGREF